MTVPRAFKNISCSLTFTPEGQAVMCLFAVAEDGTGWEFDTGSKKWKPVVPLPPVQVAAGWSA